MTHRRIRAFVLPAALLALTLLPGGPAAAAPPEPADAVTLADVEKILGGKFKARSPEPGVLFYEEEAGGYRTVQVYLTPANGKNVQGMQAQYIQWGEPVEDVPGVGDAAMYRPQRSEVEVEKKVKSGEVLWLAVGVQGAASSSDTKRFAVELAKRGAARL